MTGAPGSKWSSVSKNIYYSDSIDRSDYSESRTYYHDAMGSGTPQLMHMGAYFDPGMEFGKAFNVIERFSKDECEYMFDEPFSGEGVRIVKSHVFAHKIEFLRKHWPDCPIVLVHRKDDSCLGWWVKCGHFDITYPKYAEYYRDLKTMSRAIASQNEDIMTAWSSYPGTTVTHNGELAIACGILPAPVEYEQYYHNDDIKVKVI